MANLFFIWVILFVIREQCRKGEIRRHTGEPLVTICVHACALHPGKTAPVCKQYQNTSITLSTFIIHQNFWKLYWCFFDLKKFYPCLFNIRVPNHILLKNQLDFYRRGNVTLYVLIISTPLQVIYWNNKTWITNYTQVAAKNNVKFQPDNNCIKQIINIINDKMTELFKQFSSSKYLPKINYVSQCLQVISGSRPHVYRITLVSLLLLSVPPRTCTELSWLYHIWHLIHRN